MVQKELRIFFNDFEKGFWNGVIEGEKMGSHGKGFLKLKRLSPIKMLTSPLFEEIFGAFFSSVSWGLGGFDDIWGWNHFFKNFFSNDFNILTVDTWRTKTVMSLANHYHHSVNQSLSWTGQTRALASLHSTTSSSCTTLATTTHNKKYLAP
jgi:hypothetical protein